MANPLRRVVSSSQVSDWFKMNGAIVVPSRFVETSVEYLIVAGGGGGGSNFAGGGGGAGGYRTGTLSIGFNTAAYVQVGGGGAGDCVRELRADRLQLPVVDAKAQWSLAGEQSHLCTDEQACDQDDDSQHNPSPQRSTASRRRRGRRRCGHVSAWRAIDGPG